MPKLSLPLCGAAKAVFEDAAEPFSTGHGTVSVRPVSRFPDKLVVETLVIAPKVVMRPVLCHRFAKVALGQRYDPGQAH